MKQSIHISDLNAFLSCRRAWNWSSNLRQHLTTIRPYEPFYFGTVMHSFFERWYDPSWILPDVLKKHSIDALKLELSLLPEAIPEFIEFGATLFDHYLVWQQNQQDILSDRNFASLSVEQSFDVPILTPAGYPSSKFRFAGRVDGVWRSRVDGKLYLHEIKTTSSIDGRLAQLAFEYQPTAYMLAMSEVYKEPIAGVVYTLIRKKLPADPDVLKNGMLSKNKGIDTTADHYLACIRKHHTVSGDHADVNIKAEYGDILSTLLNQPNRFFRRHLVKRSPEQLAEMRRILYEVAHDMTNKHVAIYQTPGYFCNNCQFSVPCLAMSQGQPIDPILSEHYTRNTRLD
jgi:hypothetical protein